MDSLLFFFAVVVVAVADYTGNIRSAKKKIALLPGRREKELSQNFVTHPTFPGVTSHLTNRNFLKLTSGGGKEKNTWQNFVWLRTTEKKKKKKQWRLAGRSCFLSFSLSRHGSCSHSVADLSLLFFTVLAEKFTSPCQHPRSSHRHLVTSIRMDVIFFNVRVRANQDIF